MAPKRARISRNDDAGTSREHEKLMAEEKGKGPMVEQHEGSNQEQVVAQATQEVNPRTQLKSKSVKVKLTLHYARP